jgi:hypothetical protein
MVLGWTHLKEMASLIELLKTKVFGEICPAGNDSPEYV